MEQQQNSFNWEAATCIVYKMLLEKAAANKKTGFNTVRNRLAKEFGQQLSYSTFDAILAMVNSRSWQQLHCLLTSFVVSKDGIPGYKFYRQGCSLQGIRTVPSQFEEQRDWARNEQERAHRAVLSNGTTNPDSKL